MKKLKGVDGALDDAWSLLVKLRAGHQCEIPMCGKTQYLNSHHIYTRANRSTRWDVKNGVCLCPSHHTLDSKFSAHGSPVLFVKWLVKTKGNDFMNALELRAHSLSKLHKFEKQLLLDELNKEIKTFK